MNPEIRLSNITNIIFGLSMGLLTKKEFSFGIDEVRSLKLKYFLNALV